MTHAENARQWIARIEAARHLNAFTWFDPDALLASAQAADRAQAEGHVAGLLAGVPVAVKDSIDTPPFPTTSGSRLLSELPASQPAAVWARLAAHGALLLGKTNMDELGCGGSSRSPRFGVVDNPLMPGHTAGGSSGGSAAALAAGLAPMALGSDTSGSLRIPASFCGVAAFRPSTAGGPRSYPTQGIVPLTAVFDTPGPMARSVAELVRLHH
ncbi:MAG: amidase, partial [Rubrivivax sp.]